MNPDRKEFHDNYIKNYMTDNVPSKFMIRFKHLCKKIEMYLMLDEYENLDKAIRFALKMIKKEIKNAYCRSRLTFGILKAINLSPLVDPFDKVVEVFEKEFDEIVKEDDSILIESWIEMHCKIFVEKERMDKEMLVHVMLTGDI